jgi:hypothetical protein
MNRPVLAFVAVVFIVVALVIGANLRTVSLAAPRESSHFIYATPANVAGVKAAFLRFKIQKNEMVRTDRIVWDRINTPTGPKKVYIAYDALDDREWAIAYFSLVHPASIKAEISFQDGGSIGVFNKIGSGEWFMIWSPALPLCPGDFPSVVAHLWGPKIFAACN